MTKERYLSFAAWVEMERVLMIRLYPEQDGAVRLPKARSGSFIPAAATAFSRRNCPVKTSFPSPDQETKSPLPNKTPVIQAAKRKPGQAVYQPMQGRRISPKSTLPGRARLQGSLRGPAPSGVFFSPI